MTEEEKRKLAEYDLLLEAVRAAYWHMDTYGIVRGDDREMDSQRNVFKLCRRFCHPLPGEPKIRN